MSITLGFIVFFISIIIPGILFRRFYFFGEFSKQFNTKDPVLHSIFFSIVPGILVQLISFILYALILGFDTDFFDIFLITRDLTSSDNVEPSEVTRNFINDDLTTFITYSLFVFTFSAFIGWSSSQFIRASKWDKRFKLFRFKNQWYYIFSGEVLKMKKFIDAHSHKQNVGFNKLENQDVLVTYADILVSVSDQNDKKELYSGFVVDYDLKSDDSTQLDKVYLIDTERYKKKQVGNTKSEKDTNVLSKQDNTKSRNRLKVPGDIFILAADRIVNINLTYVPSFPKIQKKKLKEEKSQKKRSRLINLHILLLLLFIIIHIFYSSIFNVNTAVYNYFNQATIWGKVLMVLLLNQIISFFMPVYDENKKLVFDFSLKSIILKFFLLLIWTGLAYFFVYKKIY